jgi:DNA invertase Pin-like site-specific DNA recombinase
MDEQKKPRAWIYARIPGDYDGTMNSYKVCSMQALHDGCDIVGGSIDERGGWLLRPGYREMMRQVKAGEIDRIYIYRMRQISGKEQHLFRFFQQVMQQGIKVVTLEYSLRDRLHEYRLEMKIENYAARHKLPLPW